MSRTLSKNILTHKEQNNETHLQRKIKSIHNDNEMKQMLGSEVKYLKTDIITIKIKTETRKIMKGKF